MKVCKLFDTIACGEKERGKFALRFLRPSGLICLHKIYLCIELWREYVWQAVA